MSIAKRLGLFLIIFVLLLGAAAQMAPWFAISWVEDYYTSQGDNHQLTINDWSFNLIDGRLTLNDTQASWDKENAANINEIVLDIEWLPLFSKHVLVDAITIKGLNLPITQNQQTTTIAGIDMPSNTEQDTTSNSASKQSDNSNNWSMKVNRIDLVDHTYSIGTNLVSTVATINALQIRNIDTRAPSGIKLELTSTLAQLATNSIKQSTKPLAINLKGTLDNLLENPLFTGQLKLDNLHFVNPIVDIEQISIDGIELDKTAFISQQLSLSGISLGDQRDDTFWLTTDRYWMNGLTLTQSGLTTGIHYISGLKMNNYRNEQGEMPIALMQSEDTSETTQAKAPASQDTFFINVEGITLQNEADSFSTIWFRDHSVAPNYIVPFSLKAFSISALAMKDLNAPFEPDVNISLAASVDDYSKINFNAQLNRENGWPVGNAQLALEQFNIIPLNGYMSTAIGYRAQKGMLNINTDVTLNDEQLSGTTRIFLRNSKLEPQDEDTISRVSKRISMPVDTALDLLRDDNGNLQLSVPMSGKISDPNFAYDDVMSQLGTLALKTASMHYLQQSLQPYGALVSLLSFAKDSLMAIRLNQLNFETNQSDLSAEHKEYLDKVVKIMVDRTELELQVCPYVSETEAKRDTWRQLAQSRAESVKAYLAQHQDKENDSLAKRATLCVSQVSDSAHVDLGF
ncbi:DUF748 domain-containing protein [Bermanella sp. R86510]|uniref:DUF748 domain-containing protein n=1 Tax=unclassified Bermanella TaxID=2627862 RepID=UPI0037C9CD62